RCGESGRIGGAEYLFLKEEEKE
ncbi:hypothetical protein LCGC14_1925010, partial [marine sediment metagenome]